MKSTLSLANTIAALLKIAAIDMPTMITSKKYKLYQQIRITLDMKINEVL
jgi:hypothetical protein